MDFRRANKDDVEQFVATRIEFLTLIRTIGNADEFRDSTLSYIKSHIEQDDLAIYLALDQGKIVASCMACLYQTPPLPSCLTGKTAELLNVYTQTDYRRKGIAERLVRMLLAELQERAVEKVMLDYTDDGLPLYQKLGFTILPCQMELKLPLKDR